MHGEDGENLQLKGKGWGNASSSHTFPGVVQLHHIKGTDTVDTVGGADDQAFACGKDIRYEVNSPFKKAWPEAQRIALPRTRESVTDLEWHFWPFASRTWTASLFVWLRCLLDGPVAQSLFSCLFSLPTHVYLPNSLFLWLPWATYHSMSYCARVLSNIPHASLQVDLACLWAKKKKSLNFLYGGVDFKCCWFKKKTTRLTNAKCLLSNKPEDDDRFTCPQKQGKHMLKLSIYLVCHTCSEDGLQPHIIGITYNLKFSYLCA